MKHKTKKLPKLPKPAVPSRFKRRSREERLQEAISTIPRITNETVAEHRERVLAGARKYKYPLEHSKHRIVIISTALLVTAAVLFFVYCGLALYKFQTTSAFMYRVTEVIPFPVAKAGNSYVSYASYLFELRRYVHYYQTQQKVDFSSTSGKQQLASYRPKALQQVIDAAYVKQLAAQYDISVSNSDVMDELTLLRNQNRLGSSQQELADVVNEFFGWSMNDLKQELQQELLAQKVAAKLDTATQARAQQALTELQHGAAFADVAKAMSDDSATKANGGAYATAITSANTDLPPQVLRVLLGMKTGQTSGIIYAGNTLEIVHVYSIDHGQVKAAHISFAIKPISTYITPLEKQHPPTRYISVK